MLPAKSRDGWRTAALLAAITAAGAALRFYGLDIQSLWNDELSTWTEVSQPTWIEVVKHSAREHPPGFSLLLHLWILCFGDSETLLRLPSAIAGTLVIPATFALGRKLYGEAEALIAAALMAVFWMPVYYSQEARAYILIMLLAALSANWLVDITHSLLRRQWPPAGVTIGYVLTATAACYAHYFGLFLVALQGAFVGLLLLFRNGSWMRLAALYAVVVLAYTPWLSRAGPALASGAPGWLAPPTPGSLWELTCFMFNRSNGIAIACLLFGIAALLQAWRRRGGAPSLSGALTSPTALLLLWVIAPVTIVYVRSVLVAPAFTGRNFSIIVPPLYLLVARSITAVAPGRTRTWVVASVLVTLLTVHLLFVMRYYERQTKAQFRQATEYFVEHDDPAAAVVVLASASNGRYFDYYLERLGSPRRVDRLAVQRGDLAAAIDLIDAEGPHEIWLLAAHRLPDDAVISGLNHRFLLLDQHRFVFAHVWRFRYRGKPVRHW